MKPIRLAPPLLALASAAAVLGLSCRDKNEDATKECRSQNDGEKCQKCCDEQGAEGFLFVSGDGCTCRGVKPPPSASASASAAPE